MSGELQTIPARHGVATFVPRGRTVKVINTYGKQVVSMWAFSLGAPPADDDEEGEEEKIDEEQVQKEAEELKKAVEEGKMDGAGEANQAASSKPNDESAQNAASAEKETESTEEQGKTKDAAEDPPEQAPESSNNDKSTESTEDSNIQPQKRTWASYLPSIPYRNKGAATKLEEKRQPTAEEEKAQNEANTKKWSSYIPTGKSFSSYVPSVQLPDSKEAISSFKASHFRDPNKSYAEQLYDFSKTPVGAGTIAAATGSGYASSVYAAYSAYASTHPSSASQPPMEYLSLPHTRASTHKLVPEVDDELLTNLRNPIMTIVEDTSPGAHDTLTAACDAHQYAALGVDKPEEHGSCAENLVLALKELNENAGLKGAKAVGADITVNIAPTPLHLFMNAPLVISNEDGDEGAGAKGVALKVDEPKGKKRAFIRIRAERDVVVVFSACPMDVGRQNGGRCMAANYMVEDVQEGEDLTASISSVKSKKAPKKATPKKDASTEKPNAAGRKSEAESKPKVEQNESDPAAETEKPKRPPPKKLQSNKSVPKANSAMKDSDSSQPPASQDTSKVSENDDKKQDATSDAPKEKKKPKKLEVRKK